jgi:hypothetical protein
MLADTAKSMAFFRSTGAPASLPSSTPIFSRNIGDLSSRTPVKPGEVSGFKRRFSRTEEETLANESRLLSQQHAGLSERQREHKQQAQRQQLQAAMRKLKQEQEKNMMRELFEEEGGGGGGQQPTPTPVSSPYTPVPLTREEQEAEEKLYSELLAEGIGGGSSKRKRNMYEDEEGRQKELTPREQEVEERREWLRKENKSFFQQLKNQPSSSSSSTPFPSPSASPTTSEAPIGGGRGRVNVIELSEKELEDIKRSEPVKRGRGRGGSLVATRGGRGGRGGRGSSSQLTPRPRPVEEPTTAENYGGPSFEFMPTGFSLDKPTPSSRKPSEKKLKTPTEKKSGGRGKSTKALKVSAASEEPQIQLVLENPQTQNVKISSLQRQVLSDSQRQSLAFLQSALGPVQSTVAPATSSSSSSIPPPMSIRRPSSPISQYDYYN